MDAINMDNAALNQQRVRRDPPAAGGWSVFWTTIDRLDQISPASHLMIRGSGERAFPGWSDSPRIEALWAAWPDVPDEAACRELCAAMRRQAVQDAPSVPLGQSLDPTAYRRNLRGVPRGFRLFWNVGKA